MRISFDLDDTLICDRKYTPQERDRVPFFLKPWINEPLRLGTCALMQELKQWGHEIWIYTTSYRSPCYVRLWLRCYGIQVAGVINQNIHRVCLHRYSGDLLPSKNPRAFGINLHVDDSIIPFPIEDYLLLSSSSFVSFASSRFNNTNFCRGKGVTIT